jgi:hypothetical protein
MADVEVRPVAKLFLKVVDQDLVQFDRVDVGRER